MLAGSSTGVFFLLRTVNIGKPASIGDSNGG